MWLWLGDAVYPPMRAIAPVSVLEQEYQALQQTKGYNELVKSTPFVFGTWDDHDYGGNDMGKDMPEKSQRRDAFWRFLGHAPAGEAENRQGVYHSITLGETTSTTNNQQVKIILLDTRTYRDDHCGIPSLATLFPLGAGVACATRWIMAGLGSWYCRHRQATMLGEAQWQWLQQELETSTAAVHIIASSVQVLSTNPVRIICIYKYLYINILNECHSLYWWQPQVMEGWCHYPSERTRLLRMLQNVPGVILLSGDVHYAEILDATPSITEVTSSGMTHVCTKHIYGPLCKPLLNTFKGHRSQQSVDGYYIQRNFGSLEIDWESNTVEVKIHDALTGETVLSTTPLRIVSQKPQQMSDTHLEQIPTCMDGHLIQIVFASVAGLVLLIFIWRRR